MSTNPETAALVRYLNAQREHVLSAVDGLTASEMRQATLPSGWHIVGLLNHLTIGVEHYWFRCIINGGSLAELPDGDWVVSDEVTATEAIDRYRESTVLSNAILTTATLDAPPRQRDPGWAGLDHAFRDVRDIALHVLAETACHAGQLDAARELLDGHQWLVIP